MAAVGMTRCADRSDSCAEQKIPDASFSASTTFADQYSAFDGRLNDEWYWAALAPGTGEDHWLQVDLGQTKTIVAMDIQGSQAGLGWEEWVQLFTVAYSTDGSTYTDYAEGGRVVEFEGNTQGEIDRGFRGLTRTPWASS
jgi:hypothetical protein